jgi:copper amine oxidase domain-containing protein
MRAKKVLLFIFAAVLGLSLLSHARREIPVDGRLVLLDVLPMFGRKSIPVPTGEKRTAGETENADLPIERPARRRIAMNLQGKEIYTGQKIEQLRQTFGEPDRIEMGIYGLQWYIYHKDYSCFLMAAVSDGVVCGYYTNSAGFEIDGRAKADTCCGDWDPDIKLYRDKLDGDKVYAVFVVWEESKQSIDTTEREFLGIQARENFDVTNAFRVKKGLNPLLWDEIAAEAARLHAIDMGKKDYFSHISLDGRTPIDRYLRLCPVAWRAWGENISAGREFGIDHFDAWLNSEGHRENLLSDKFKYLGVGAAYCEESTYRYYFGQTFITY